jgi:uncharacterized protein (TIGR02421 family)
VAISQALGDRLREVSAEILEASRTVRVLRALAWPPEIEQRFFAAGGGELPRPTYRVAPDIAAARDRLLALKARLGGANEIERFLRDTCDSLATAARMVLAAGTKDFYFHSVELYGRPGSLSSDRKTTNLGLARHFEQVIAGFSPPRDAEDLPTIDAEEAAPVLARRFQTFFGDRAVRVQVVEGLSANATASAEEIKLKRGARFSPRDLRQIEFHEGHVHVATALNGRAQPVIGFVGFPTPRTTSTQEGLAVLTEFLTRSTSLPRVRRLADRVIAIESAEGGASFVDVYRLLRDRGYDEAEAFDGARRVFRGGLVEGGAPFTKDVCYLDGLLRVTNFLRIALTRGKSRYARWLFAGKLAVEDVPLFERLVDEGLAIEPRYVPAWATDLSYLTAFMSYAAFLGESDLSVERRRLEDALSRAEAEM